MAYNNTKYDTSETLQFNISLWRCQLNNNIKKGKTKNQQKVNGEGKKYKSNKKNYNRIISGSKIITRTNDMQ
jgi:hypothetical protein